MVFAGPGELVCGNEFRRVRSKDRYRKTMGLEEYTNMEMLHGGSKQEGTHGNSDLRIINYKDEDFKIERKKPRWEVFEDKVWQMFYHLRTPIMPIGKTVIEYGDGLTKQIDGLFSDDEYVYIVECKWRMRKNNQDQSPGDIIQEILEWRGMWDRMVDSLGVIEEFRGKKFQFILATTGIKWSKALRSQADGFAKLIDQNSVDEIIGLCKMIGPSARTNLMQKLFMHEKLPSKIEQFPCIRSTEGGRNTFYFFAKPSDVVDQCYVPRRSPGSSRQEQLYGLGSSYQRMLKPKKVSQISEYLKNPSTFFPNSVILSCSGIGFSPTDDGSVGYLSLPHHYGSVMVIDGQHRLYGSIRSGEEKMLPFCVIEGMDGLQQSELFAQINQSQSAVPAELLWDLWGEGEGILKMADDNDKSSITAAKRYIVSNIWKNLNSSPSHPLAGRIIIPSQTEKGGLCHMSFGQISGFLYKNKKVWDYGYLRGEGSWEDALPFAQHRVGYFFKYLHQYLPEEFEKACGGKGKDGWLLSNYSLEALIAIFVHACIFFAGSPAYQKRWLKGNTNSEEGNALEILKEFAEVLSRALVDERRGFYNVEGKRNIRDQGNSAQRNEYMKDLVKFVIEDKPLYKGHFAPTLDLGEAEGDYPSAETRRRIRDLEGNYRSAIYNLLLKRDEGQWWAKLPRDVSDYITRQMDYKKMQGKKFARKPDEGWFKNTTTGHLLKVMMFKSNVSDWKEFISVSPDMFAYNWSYGFEIIRNMDAHDDPYPHEDTKQQAIASIGNLERWLDAASMGDNPPTIEIIGDPEVSVSVGDIYEDAGATAWDEEDGDISSEVVISGLPVNTSEKGIHMITYDVTDSSGNEAIQVTRTILILSEES